MVLNKLKRNKAQNETSNAPAAAPATKSVTQVKNWYTDRYQSTVIQRNILMLVTFIALTGIVVGAFIVQRIVSSKTIEPFVIEVKEKSGIATVVDPLTAKQFVGNRAVVEFFIAKYLNARQGYNEATYIYDSTQVTRLLSASPVYSEFRKTLRNDNPDNLFNKLGKNIIRKVKITSILPAGDKAVHARFVLQDIKRGGSIIRRSHKIATIGFSFNPELKLSQEERYINPLGFQVTSYQVSDEIIDTK